jgi:hypothetical protein
VQRFAVLLCLAVAPLSRAEDPAPEPLPASYPSSAPAIRDAMHARDYAMAGAYRAHGLGAESITGNPAALTLYRRYQIELSGAWDPATQFGFGTVAVADSQTSELGAGLAYDLVSFGEGASRRTAHLNTLALALPLLDFVHVGAGVRHILETGARESNAITLDAGVILRFLEAFTLGFAGHNLIDTANPDMSTFYSVSAAYCSGLFTVAADARIDLGVAETAQVAYSLGGEYIFAQGIPLRFGYQFDGISKTQYVGAGIGLMTESGAVDFGYRHELGGLNGRMLALTIKVYVH